MAACRVCQWKDEPSEAAIRFHELRDRGYRGSISLDGFATTGFPPFRHLDDEEIEAAIIESEDMQ